MINRMHSYDTTIAQCESPMTGVHNVYKANIFSTMNHPQNVGLKTENLKTLQGEYARVRIYGIIDKDVVDCHDSPHMIDHKVLYKKGYYDFITVQKKAQDWSGWFND